MTDSPRADAASKALLAERALCLSRLRAEREAVQEDLAWRDPAERAFRDRVAQTRRACVILGSPRGGSSVLHAVLRRARGALAVAGEHRPLLTLLGLTFPDSGLPDEGGADRADSRVVQAFWRELAWECDGPPDPEPEGLVLERFACTWALRLRLQWPELDLPLERLLRAAHDATRAERARRCPIQPEAVAVRLLRMLIDEGIPLDPHLYALPADVLASAFADIAPGRRPPASTIVEIAPYILPVPSRRPNVRADATWVLKNSSDAYRTRLLSCLLEGYEVRYVHLTRNPLAAVNGLLDGWAHHCFWQHDLSALGWPCQPLEEGIPRCWWCFDLPTRWPELYDAPLHEICAEQWREPHARIMSELTPWREHVRRVSFEAFQAGGSQRKAMLSRLVVFGGLKWSPAIATACSNPPSVNVTAAWKVARWRGRPWLAELLKQPPIATLASALGYELADAARWA
jgi:hypothetical protein